MPVNHKIPQKGIPLESNSMPLGITVVAGTSNLSVLPITQTPELPYGRNRALPIYHQFGASLQTYPLAAWVHDLSIGRCLIDLAMASVLKSMNRDTIPAQGYRSTFRDRTSEHKSFPRETYEHALPYRIGDKS